MFDKLGFMKLIMKIIACTPNQNFDQHHYEENVIIPAKSLRELRDRIDQIDFNKELVVATFAKFKSILTAKKLDTEEFKIRLLEFSSIEGIAEFINIKKEVENLLC